jgi:hypothetical protein
MTYRFINKAILLRFAVCNAIICLICVLKGPFAFAESHGAPGTGAVTDFVDYWAASRLLIDGRNPFSYGDVLELQRSAGYTESSPMLLWYPPWTLSFILPFGAMDYGLSHFLWLTLHVFFLLLSAQKLWAIYDLGARKSYLPWLAIFTFVPTWMVLIMGNIAPLILLGIIGFLHFEKRNQLFFAGVSTTLISVKPHLLYLFWIGLILWMWRHRRWRVAFGAITAGLVVAVIPVILDPWVYYEFIQMYRFPGRSTPLELPAPSLGSLLTLYVPHGKVPIQFLPPLLGALWFIWHWTRYKDRWDWSEQMPMILMVSLTMSPYAWTYDQVILLPAIIQALAIVRDKMAPWYKNPFVLLYCGINLAYFISKLFVTTDIYYFWLAPAFLLTYVGVTGRWTLATIGYSHGRM